MWPVPMVPAPVFATDLTTILGRIILMFRRALGLSQAEFGDFLHYDRSLIARLEVGRNLANIDNIHQIETLLRQRQLMARHGDLVLLTNRVAYELSQRGFGLLHGRTEEVPGVAPMDMATLDRVVNGVVDTYILSLPQGG